MVLEKLVKDPIGRYLLNRKVVDVKKLGEVTIGELLHIVRASRGKYDPLEWREKFIPDGADAYSFSLVETVIRDPHRESLDDYAVYKIEFFSLKEKK